MHDVEHNVETSGSDILISQLQQILLQDGAQI